jgi:phage regulator Rha-like protein
MTRQEVPMSPAELEQRIFLLRGRRVMLSTHLAGMYGVEVRALVQAVKRNVERFPEDFMFQLTAEEFDSLRSQIVILDAGRGQHSKYLPYAFTQEGVAMLSSVLRSSRAVQVNIGIMRAFVRIREMLGAHRDLQARLNELERKYDAQFKVVFDAIRQITAPAAPSRKQISYVPNERKRPGAK